MSEYVPTGGPHGPPGREPPDGEIRPEKPSGRVLERVLLLVIALGVTTGAVALVVTAQASQRAADAQRDLACHSEASSRLYDLSLDFDLDDPEAGSADLQRQQDEVKRALEDCGIEFPEGE